MKIKQTNADGVEEEIEVHTDADVAAKLEEKDKEHGQKITEITGKLTNLEGEKSELQKKFDALGGKEDHPNFKVLKEALDKKDGDITALRTELNTDKDNRKKEAIDDLVSIASKGDAELEKKIRLHLTTTLAALKDDTKEDKQKKIEAAYKLSTDSSSAPGPFDRGTGNGGRGSEVDENRQGAEFTPRERSLGKKLGISDEDYKKYEKDPRIVKK